jgi:hypothetical protein
MTWTKAMAAARPATSSWRGLAAAHRAARRLALPPGRTATATMVDGGGGGAPEAIRRSIDAEELPAPL